MGTMQKRVIYQSVAAIGLLLAVTHTPAQARFVITPHIETTLQHNSNFFRTETNEKSVTTWTISPGLQVIYKTAKTKATFDGTLDRFQYYGGNVASGYDYTGGRIAADIQNQVNNHLLVGMQDNMRVTRDPEYIDDVSQQVGREKYLTNVFTPHIYYAFSHDKFGIGARYQNKMINYSEASEDYAENRGILNFFYNFNRSTSAFLEYHIWKGEYDRFTSDYLSNKVTVNVSKQFNYFTLTAGAGYRSRTFDDSGYKNINGFTGKIMAEGRDRRDDDSDRMPRSFVTAALIHDLNDYGAGGSYYTATRLELRGGYLIGPRLGISGLGLYQHENYELNPNNRTDDLYVISGQVDYALIDKLSVAVEGGHRKRNSDQAGQSYDDTFIIAKLKYAYDFGHE